MNLLINMQMPESISRKEIIACRLRCSLASHFSGISRPFVEDVEFIAPLNYLLRNLNAKIHAERFLSPRDFKKINNYPSYSNVS